ncbi:MAG: hypothetical protein JRN52_04545 [Nitrososphaerota archaeon]|nr:hypothetical protein [Nitrososphaerota archaeon]
MRTTKLSSRSSKLARELSQIVGEGESEAIALAVERRERLFIDDQKGRRTAELYRLETTTTLGVILELLANNTLTKSDYVRNVRNYGAQGWISGEVIQEFIRRGEDL